MIEIPKAGEIAKIAREALREKNRKAAEEAMAAQIARERRVDRLLVKFAAQTVDAIKIAADAGTLDATLMFPYDATSRKGYEEVAKAVERLRDMLFNLYYAPTVEKAGVFIKLHVSWGK